MIENLEKPERLTYDIIIIGGAIMGSSAAWFLTNNKDFDGRILVVEKDPSYEFSSTAHTNSCIRQQFSTERNIQISQFGAEFYKNLRANMGGDERIPDLEIQNYGYLYLADNEDFADVLRSNQSLQLATGTQTELLSSDDIKTRYPFYNVDDVVLGSINTKDEGYFDGGILFDWWRRGAKSGGVEYISNEVVAMTKNQTGTRVETITLKSGEVIACDKVVNASGPRGARTAMMAGIDLPVEPRKRFTWIFTAETPLDRELPLTIDPSGVHFRQDGPTSYLAGCKNDPDPAVDFDDFSMDHDIWQNHVWPIIATRIPQFESIRVTAEWAGHYAYNVVDQNAIIGLHHEVKNFIFLNGFSGHGLQQSPAMGRGVSELIAYGEFRTLDLSAFSFDRIVRNEPLIEKAVI